MKSPEINSQIYGQLVYNKRMQMDHYLIRDTKMSSKQIKLECKKPKTIKLLEHTVGELPDTGLGNYFSGRTPKTKAKKAKINKKKLYQTNKLLHRKEY